MTSVVSCVILILSV